MMVLVLTRFTVALGLLVVVAVAAAAEQTVFVVGLDDTIQPASLRYLKRGLEKADAAGAEVTIVELNTPGGLLTSLRQMTTEITGAARPVVVYVTPSGAQAASAGFFLLVAADVAAMAPGTNAGAAHPVGGQGEEIKGPMGDKMTNDAAALIRSLAEARGRSQEWAEKAVRESLSYTATEAKEKDLIDLIAADRAELLRDLDGRTITRFSGRQETLRLDDPKIVTFERNLGDEILSVIAHPNVAYLLMLLGMIGIYIEISHPGLVLPGVLGGIAILLALFALSVLPVNVAGILLILLGIGFFVAEVKVTSYGLLTAAGLTSFVLGSLMLVDSPIPALRVGLEVVLPAAVMVAAIVIFLVSRVVKTHRAMPITGSEGLLAEIGTVATPIDPEGKVFIHGEYWTAVAAQPLAAGTRVRVVRVLGDRLEVAPAAPSP